MSSGKMKLTYFNIRGRAELARLVLAQAGVDYEDNRVSGDSWKAFKPTTPFGQLPVLEVDGEVIGQSFTIARLLARRYGLGGDGDLEQARADMIVEGCGDVFNKLIGIWFEKDEAKKQEKKESFEKEWLPTCMQNFEKLLKKNGGDYFVGKDCTYADLCIADTFGPVGPIARLGAEWKAHAPGVAALVDRVNNLPKIKKWIETRPESTM